MTDTPSLRRSFRLVCNPGQIPSVEALLSAQGFVFEPEPFSPLARRLLQEPFPLGRSLAAFWGYVYIQDRSSMLPPLALAPGEGARVLDMCASPGSKTGLLAQLVGREGLVLGNEPARPRLATLRRNLAALNLLQAVTCSWPGESLPLPDASWDAVLLDPPCSGWGTTDKNPQAIKRWQGDRLKPMLDLQRKLLTEASRLLRPGGKLVYSTCTTNVDENEGQVRFAVEELGLEPIPLEPFPGFVFAAPELPGCEGTLRVDEGASNAQGFYIALLRKPGDSAAVPGKGVRADAVIGGRAVACLCGNASLLRDAGIAFDEAETVGTVVYAAADGMYLGCAVFADELKADSADALRDLAALGITDTTMLTGDKRAIAERVAKEVGISAVKPELLPADKVAAISALRESGKKLVYVGDGINDAPGLALADVGVAMGGIGSAAALEAADVVIMGDSLKKLPAVIRIARKTMRIVRENIGFSLAVKALILILSAVGAANMWHAVFADVGVLVLATLNAMRALRT